MDASRSRQAIPTWSMRVSRGVVLRARGEGVTPTIVSAGPTLLLGGLVMPGSVIVSGARTPIGKPLGSLARFQAVDPGGIAIEHALARARVGGPRVPYVMMGRILQAGAWQITARQAAVKGRIPMTVP